MNYLIFSGFTGLLLGVNAVVFMERRRNRLLALLLIYASLALLYLGGKELQPHDLAPAQPTALAGGVTLPPYRQISDPSGRIAVAP